ncbi:MAG: hypothetical protein V8Q84_12220 [Bilophila sp.]
MLFTLTLGGALWAFHPVGSGSFGSASAPSSAWNFYALIKFVPKIISNGWSKNNLMGLLIHTNMRLLFTGILLYMALVWWQGPLSAILSGARRAPRRDYRRGAEKDNEKAVLKQNAASLFLTHQTFIRTFTDAVPSFRRGEGELRLFTANGPFSGAPRA